MSQSEELAKKITSLVERFIDSPSNTFNDADEPAWAEPIVGFSNGADPLYEFYRRDIGEFYVTPVEYFRNAHPSVDVNAADLTVLSWVLPHTEATKKDHRKEKSWPCERWAKARIFGEQVNVKLRKFMVSELEKMGLPSIAPMLSPLWRDAESKKYGFASTWSERHAAYAAGLGTFGLSDGLITAKGKAHRVGSLIVKARIEPTLRGYVNHHAYCLFYANGTCGACIGKCPAGAISDKGHDKKICSDYVEKTRSYVENRYGFKGYGCGLCQVGVPCESRIPEGISV